MSQLFVVTHPSLVHGFQLAGVDARGADSVKAAQELIEKWLTDGEVGLLAIDENFLASMDKEFLQRLESSANLPYIAIPRGKPLEPETSQSGRTAALIRRAIGFHITSKG